MRTPGARHSVNGATPRAPARRTDTRTWCSPHSRRRQRPMRTRRGARTPAWAWAVGRASRAAPRARARGGAAPRPSSTRPRRIPPRTRTTLPSSPPARRSRSRHMRWAHTTLTLAPMRTRTHTAWHSPSPTRRRLAARSAGITAAGACSSTFRGRRAQARLVRGRMRRRWRWHREW